MQEYAMEGFGLGGGLVSEAAIVALERATRWVQLAIA